MDLRIKDSPVLCCWEAVIFHSFIRHLQVPSSLAGGDRHVKEWCSRPTVQWSGGTRFSWEGPGGRGWPLNQGQDWHHRRQSISPSAAIAINSISTEEMYWEMERSLFVLLHIVPDILKGMIKQTGGEHVRWGLGCSILAHSHVWRYLLTSGCVYPLLFSFIRANNASNFLSPLEKHKTITGADNNKRVLFPKKSVSNFCFINLVEGEHGGGRTAQSKWRFNWA